MFDNPNQNLKKLQEQLLAAEEPEEEAPEEEDIVQHVSPLTDMDSLDFYLWVEEGAQAEADRRQNKPSKPPKAE